ncbi:MAG: YkgJ family cysteine cluster protein [Phycisphaerae bacterium]
MSDADCAKCNAKCCRYFCFEIDAPEDVDEFEDVRWFLLHEGISVHVDEGDWYISIMNPCRHIGQDNRCGIYEDRPLICRKYSQDNCDATGGDYEYEEFFETAEQLEAYARKKLGKKFDKKRDKARRKLQPKMKVKLTAKDKDEKPKRKAKGKSAGKVATEE